MLNIIRSHVKSSIVVTVVVHMAVVTIAATLLVHHISCDYRLLWLLFVLQHSDDDDDDDGNYRQQHKLHSSKDSSILSSEFSDTDYLLLPATLSFHPTQEGALLTGLISDTNCDDVKFKLSPAFALYFIAKHHLSAQYQPGLHGGERKKHLLVMMKSSISLIKRAVKVCCYVSPHQQWSSEYRSNICTYIRMCIIYV